VREERGKFMATYNVYNAAEFQAALSKAVGGDRILLAPGDYGKVAIHGRQYGGTVTVQSMSWGSKAHFDGLTISQSKNIFFNGLDLGRGREAGDSEFQHINMVAGSTNIRFNSSVFHGDGVPGPQNDLQALSIYDSTNVAVTYSEFVDLSRGVYVLRSSGTTLNGNDFHDIRLDGVAVAAANGITLQNNLFRDFHPVVGDHADAIQFWNTNQTRGTSNALIRNNVIWLDEDYAEADRGVQGIWISDPGTLGYRNITIENNLVYAQDRWNGITVNGGTNVKVLNNSLLSADGDPEHLWVRLENNNGVTLTGNVSEGQYLRNNVNVWAHNNHDLIKAPSLRSLFADLDSPEVVGDLVTAGIGYQPATLPFATALFAPTQEEAGSVDPDTNHSQAFGQPVIVNEPQPVLAEALAPEPVGNVPVAPFRGFDTDWFTAIP
jgi:parallel beta-helix repeat protein